MTSLFVDSKGSYIRYANENTGQVKNKNKNIEIAHCVVQRELCQRNIYVPVVWDLLWALSEFVLLKLFWQKSLEI